MYSLTHNNKKNNILRLILMILLLLKGFGIVIFNYTQIDYFLLVFLFALSYKTISFKDRYSKIIIYYVIFVLTSCIYSWLYNGQKFYSVLFHSYRYFAIIFFFVLLKLKPTLKEIETTIECLGILFCICYLLQYFLYPAVIFSGAESINVSQTTFRMRMPGSICCYTLLLLGVNKLLIEHKIKYLFYSILAFFPIIIQGFRSLTSLSVFTLFVMIPFVLKKMTKTIIVCVVLGFGIIYLINTNEIVQKKLAEMSERHDKEQTFSNENYIRWITLDYYWNNKFNKPLEKVIGAGEPTDIDSEYFRSIQHERAFYGYYWEDLGIVGLSMIIGMPATIILVIIYLLLMLRLKNVHFQYVRFTLLLVLSGSIMTSMELFRIGNILLLSLFIYIEYTLYKKKYKFNYPIS